jgi:hypothetical protein
MKNKYVIAPEECENYLTPGKKYKIINKNTFAPEFAFEIVSDKGNTIYCLYKGCEHLFGGDWIIVKE